MGKINILTFWGVANYGAWAQAYALNMLVKKYANENIIVNHIAYLEDSHWKMYYEKDSRLENAFFYSWDIIPHSEIFSESELEDIKFDKIIIGSDAVWEFNPAFNNDYHMFGRNLCANSIYTYAASFGNLGIDDIKEKISAYDFEKFCKISVRDSNSKRLVEMITDGKISPNLVLDPVLLWDFATDESIPKTVFSNYVLVYGVNWSEEFIKEAQVYAKEHNLKLISAGYINKWCDLNLKLVELRAKEWIGLFSNAKMVFTSTFHGLMLSISFRKQVKFNQVSYVKKRSQTLLELLHIESGVTNFNELINYSEVNIELEKQRESSLEYLESIIAE